MLLVFSSLLAFTFVGLKGLEGEYEPRRFPPALLGIASDPKMDEAELKAYQTRQKWIERGRAVRDFCLSFIGIFVFGHGVFYIVVWIIRGFR